MSCPLKLTEVLCLWGRRKPLMPLNRPSYWGRADWETVPFVDDAVIISSSQRHRQLCRYLSVSSTCLVARSVALNQLSARPPSVSFFYISLRTERSCRNEITASRQRAPDNKWITAGLHRNIAVITTVLLWIWWPSQPRSWRQLS